ncbi:hypothetical protein PHMEG_00039159, partial [Phytophthora megakarya]
MRPRRRPNPSAPTAPEHDIDFGHLRRQLKAVGRTSKRPSGIQTEWTYASPKDANILVGERAVIDYAFQSGLLVDDDNDSTEAVADDTAERVEEGHGDEH